MKKILFLFLIVQLSISATAQDKDTSANTQSSFDLGVDLANNYIWRGSIFSDAPVIQAHMSYSFKGFTVGTWSSYPFTQNLSQEVDLFISYNYKIFTFTVNDYFFRYDLFGNRSDYFDWDKTSTTHWLEGIFEVSNIKNLPLRFLAGVFFLGADIDVNNDRNFSTYFEFAYNFNIKKIGTEVFAGFTPFNGFYDNSFNIVNFGIKASREIAVNDKLSLPLSGTFAINPASQDVMFQIMVSF
jgi:uncharacterized protein (TIGR02001 family)